MALSISQVTIDYDQNDVVFDVNVDIKTGELFGLVGLNGAGKTTLIKAVLGLHAPRQGTISVLGHAQHKASSRQDIVYLPERFDPPVF